ncbi:metallophosphoesterase [Coleofasciculus sp. FACHB-1120]|uniref:metallophosphoesterase family protein n=1 Tax=Coleofasciculus sp. FACHB-1120 TaxID=2692783 RepID=UPI001F559E5E|nr:metallophosphoesterase [Coleofasciculus sp. FACHB-1120]
MPGIAAISQLNWRQDDNVFSRQTLPLSPMRIASISDQPIHEIPFITAAAAGHLQVVEQVLPILSAEADSLPPGLDAIIIASDLQGINPTDGRLLGHRVAEELETLANLGRIPSPQKTGIILAGDLYARSDKRGGEGDVREVWQSFSRRFRWVAGVAGNHDILGNTPEEIQTFKKGRGIRYLDGEIAVVDGFRIAGISGIIGKPTKLWRRSEKDFHQALRQLLKELPNILILHEGPNDPEAKLMGNQSIRAELAAANELLVICGHSHWKVPMTTLFPGVQVLNVDSRVVVLTGAKSE